MKINLDKTDSKVIHSNETYNVIDNSELDKLVVSKTELHAGKNTSGHNHSGQEEVYIFTSGRGSMLVGTETYDVRAGDIVLIPDGAFHKVWNTGDETYDGDLIFTCVFDGGRNH